MRKLSGSSVVITGATSGIGRAAARIFASEWASLMIAARGRSALEETAAECAAVGAAVDVCSLDMADPGQVDDLVRQTVERFGRIDTWVNNASTLLFGRFEDIPADAFRREIETNLTQTGRLAAQTQSSSYSCAGRKACQGSQP